MMKILMKVLLTITTRSEVNGLVTEKTEKCYGSKAELLLKAAEISGEQHQNAVVEMLTEIKSQ